jgi:hypothetical protein
LPSKETSGGSLYSVQAAKPTFFREETPAGWLGDSADDSGVKFEFVERREEDSFWKKRPIKLGDFVSP